MPAPLPPRLASATPASSASGVEPALQALARLRLPAGPETEPALQALRAWATSHAAVLGHPRVRHTMLRRLYREFSAHRMAEAARLLSWGSAPDTAADVESASAADPETTAETRHWVQMAIGLDPGSNVRPVQWLRPEALGLLLEVAGAMDGGAPSPWITPEQVTLLLGTWAVHAPDALCAQTTALARPARRWVVDHLLAHALRPARVLGLQLVATLAVPDGVSPPAAPAPPGPAASAARVRR